MNILFRADSSSKIGLGHIMRDLVLAKQFKESNIIFACQNHEGNIIDKIPYLVEILSSNESKELVKLIQRLDIDMIVFDHYGIDEDFEKEVKEKTGIQILSFDDAYEKHYCDILLNHNISANPLRYKNLVPETCELRCGSRYTLIRDEFKKEKKAKHLKKRDIKIKTIFLAMGGSDHSKIIPKILKSIPAKYRIYVVITTANKQLKQLKRTAFLNKSIILKINSNNMDELLNDSDFAIVTPSVVSYEVLFMGVPFLTILTGSDQKDIHNFFTKKRLISMEKFNRKKLTKNIAYLSKHLEIYKNKIQRLKIR